MTEPERQYQYYGLLQSVIDQLENWSIDDAKKADAEWREAGNRGRSPLDQWATWNNLLPPLQEKHKAGDSTALFLAIAHCHSSGLPLPHWCGKAVSLGLSEIERYESRGWDEAFGSPLKDKNLPPLKREHAIRTHAINEALTQISAGSPVTSTLEEVAESYGVSYQSLRSWYYAHRKAYPITEQIREDGFYRKKTGKPDSDFVKFSSLTEGLSKKR